MKMLVRTFALTLLLAITVSAFSGCRTAHGFGEDMQKAGEAIQGGTDK